MALKDITTIEETEQLSADANFYAEDGGLFRRAPMQAVKDALGLALESTATKEALLNCFRHVAWIDENGQEYYDALYDALYNIPVSITATFLQGSNTIYNTDPLSVLRQYLVVRATYEDETVQTITAYTLSGNLTAGTSTITAAYKGKTATFDVTVTQSASHIEAVYTQSGTVYNVDNIDDLKTDLVVTYYASQSATGVVVPASDYTLSGTLTAGTSTILVAYSGNTATFTVTGVVDFYNKSSWVSGDKYLQRLNYYPTNLAINSVYKPNIGAYTLNRLGFWMTVGEEGVNVLNEDGTTHNPYLYPIPVPENATTITISISPSSQYFSCSNWIYGGDGAWTYEGQTGWKQGSHTFTVTAAAKRYIALNCRRDASNTNYTESTLPTISIAFS